MVPDESDEMRATRELIEQRMIDYREWRRRCDLRDALINGAMVVVGLGCIIYLWIA